MNLSTGFIKRSSKRQITLAKRTPEKAPKVIAIEITKVSSIVPPILSDTS